MMSLCKECEYKERCEPKKQNPNIYGCSLRGAFDKDGNIIIDEEK